jgi:membrane protein implicated in regulation of membrane protease activity
VSAIAFIFESYWYWLIAGLVLVLAEMLLPGVYLLWIGVGALVVGVFTAVWPNAPLWLQLAVLAVAMVGSVLAGIYFQARTRKPADAQGLNAGLQSFVGVHGTAAEAFHAGHGRIKLNDSFYNAVTADSQEAIHKNDALVVQAVRNADLVVRKL